MLAVLLVGLRSLGLICSGHRAVVLENVALRQQLAVFRRTVRRPQLRARDRLFWVLLAKAWPKWRTALILVQPDTVVRWHREWLRRRWTQRSIHARPGRPSTAAAIRTLVDRMGAANPLWGAPRIHGELVKLGIAVSERTVSRLLRRRRRPPSQTWRTFLTNHVTSLVSMDFFTVPTLTGRVLICVRAPQSSPAPNRPPGDHRTSNSRMDGATVVDAFPYDTTPRWLVRDRDAIYGDEFRRRVAGMGMTEVISAPSSPWQNQLAERLIGSLRRECRDHVVILSQRHLRHVLARYVSYYHGARTHLALEKDAPTPRRVQASTEGPVVAFAEVGGLHHRYECRAA